MRRAIRKLSVTFAGNLPKRGAFILFHVLCFRTSGKARFLCTALSILLFSHVATDSISFLCICGFCPRGIFSYNLCLEWFWRLATSFSPWNENVFFFSLVLPVYFYVCDIRVHRVLSSGKLGDDERLSGARARPSRVVSSCTGSHNLYNLPRRFALGEES